MKILFLDIDGVLCTEECSKKPYHPVFFYPFHIDCVNIFNHILLETNAEIVITSDWRKHLEFDLNRIDQLFKFFNLNEKDVYNIKCDLFNKYLKNKIINELK